MMIFKTHPVPSVHTSSNRSNVKDQCDIKQCIPINRNISHLSIDPFIEQAQEQFFCGMLGDALLEFLCIGFNGGAEDGYKDDAAKEAIYKKLIKKARCAVAWYAYHLMIPFLNVQASDSGLVQASNEKVVSASRWAFDAVHWKACRMAFNNMEQLIWKCICPCQSEIKEQVPGYTGIVWQTDYLDNDPIGCCSYFLYSPGVFAKHQELLRDGRLETWLSLVPYMRQAEKFYLLPILCKPFFDELKAKMCAGKLDEKETQLVDCIRMYISEITLKLAAPKLNVSFGKGGYKIRDRVEAQTNSSKPNYNDKEYLDRSTELTSLKSYKAIKQCLEANREAFPSWADSECAKDPEAACKTNNPKTCGCTCPCDCDRDGGVLVSEGSVVCF